MDGRDLENLQTDLEPLGGLGIRKWDEDKSE